MARIKLCFACEKLLSASFDLKKIPRSGRSNKSEACGWCKKKSVLMDEFEIGAKKREKA